MSSIGARLRQLARRRRAAVIVIATLAAVALANLALDDYTQSLLATVMIAAIGAMSLAVLMGWVGQPSILNAALLLIGGYCGYLFATLLHLPLLLAMVFTWCVGLGVGTIAGLPARRLGGLYLALGTIAIHFIVTGLGNALQTRTNALAGYFLKHPTLFGFELRSNSSWLWFSTAVALVFYLHWRYLRGTRLGRGWILIRESRDAAAVAGVDVPLFTILAFALTSAATTVAGMMLAIFLSNVGFESYGLLVAVNYIVMITIGGAASLGGAVFGAGVVTLLPQFIGTLFGSGEDTGWLSSNLSNLESLVYGVIGAAILLFAPGGVSQGALKLWSYGRRMLAGRRLPAPVTRADREVTDVAVEAPPAGLASIRGASVEYAAGELAVDAVSLDIPPGAAIVVIGRNGAGKTSLLYSIAGFPPGTGGRVSGGDVTWSAGPRAESMQGLSIQARSRRGVTFVPAEDKVFPDLTVTEHLREALLFGRHRRTATQGRWKSLRDIWEDFPVLERRSRIMAASLSGGERTQLALACALLRSPTLLLMDEASLGLSPVAVGDVIQMLTKVRSEGEVTMLLAEQNLAVAAALADTVAVLDDGRVRAAGPPSAGIIQEVERSYLGDDVVEGHVLEMEPLATRIRERARRVGDGEEAQAVLSVTDASVVVGGVQSLSRVSLILHERQLLGLIGANGAGKTSLLNAICGYYRLSSGEILVAGMSVRHTRPYRIAASGVSRTFQLVGQVRGLTVLEFVKIGLEPTWKSSLASTLVRWPTSGRAEAEATDRALHTLERFGIAAYRGRLLEECPYGVRKLADLARACVGTPRLLLLDEPTSGASSTDRTRIERALDGFLSENDTALMLVDHNVDFVTDICEELLVLSVGRALRSGHKDVVLRDEEVIRTFLGPGVTLPAETRTATR